MHKQMIISQIITKNKIESNRGKSSKHMKIISQSNPVKNKIPNPISCTGYKKPNTKKDQSRTNISHRQRLKNESWQRLQIQKLFMLYQQYGPQWQIIKFQFIDKSCNSIKNRFYTVIRVLLKLLFKEHPLIIEKLPHEISSKIIRKFYQGRQEFGRFKGFANRVLKIANYNLEFQSLRVIVQENLVIFGKKEEGSRERDTNLLSSKKQKTTGKNNTSNNPSTKKQIGGSIKVQYNQHMNPPEFSRGSSRQKIQLSNIQEKSNVDGYLLIPSTNYYNFVGYQFLQY